MIKTKIKMAGASSHRTCQQKFQMKYIAGHNKMQPSEENLARSSNSSGSGRVFVGRRELYECERIHVSKFLMHALAFDSVYDVR